MLAWAEAQRGLDMLDGEIRLAGPEPQSAAAKPAARKARVQRQHPVDQPHHGTDVLAEIPQHVGDVSEDVRVVMRHLERLPRKIDGLAAICLWCFSPAINGDPPVAHRRPGKCRTIM